MPFPSCSGCPKCNTTLEVSPILHQIPAPHKYIIKYDQNTGEPYEICANCLQTKKEVERELDVEAHGS